MWSTGSRVSSASRQPTSCDGLHGPEKDAAESSLSKINPRRLVPKTSGDALRSRADEDRREDGRAPTFGRVACYRAAKTPHDRAACGVSAHSGDARSRGASGEGVSSCPAMECAASAPAEPCASPVASACRMVRRRQPPRPPARRMRRPIPPPIDAPRVRQPSARGNPPAAGPPLRSGPSEQARLGATGERLPRRGA